MLYPETIIEVRVVHCCSCFTMIRYIISNSIFRCSIHHDSFTRSRKSYVNCLEENPILLSRCVSFCVFVHSRKRRADRSTSRRVVHLIWGSQHEGHTECVNFCVDWMSMLMPRIRASEIEPIAIKLALLFAHVSLN